MEVQMAALGNVPLNKVAKADFSFMVAYVMNVDFTLNVEINLESVAKSVYPEGSMISYP
jgi:hypothetical protein